MTEVRLSNDQLQVAIESFGAQIISVFDQNKRERIWQADPKIWGRHAPILFPIVGRLVDDQYVYQGQTYHLTQHGFARDQEFNIIAQNKTSVTFELRQLQLQKDYPFCYSLQISYELYANIIQVSYNVQNLSIADLMYFSIGGHPAFNFAYRSKMAQLRFAKPESMRELGFTADNLVDISIAKAVPSIMDLSAQSFVNDTHIFQNAVNNIVALVQDGQTQVTLTTNAPYIGVWSPYDTPADFVCIEPWWGVADTVNNDGQLGHKFGINQLQPKQVFNAFWQVCFN
ncbi:aldose 1-epimerase family protein [Bombilactobacillus thymidiniphilus]|uniref:Aldose 1-epimerase family protein n=1 Tax=Bombilactobacillus thymidiniphilus TaxID=2923363 RepID=A0ABY4PDQ3_9LACO|nr:aldose 1-epimerase family protein [Bombilactobacillus thymidiniphilus]UQS83700.1 aldose 1-epimerase family protein [Bombilactobacillus thymidiniphilus]